MEGGRGRKGGDALERMREEEGWAGLGWAGGETGEGEEVIENGEDVEQRARRA